MARARTYMYTAWFGVQHTYQKTQEGEGGGEGYFPMWAL